MFGNKADVIPTPDAEIYMWGEELGSGMCSTVLRLPPDVTFESAELTCSRPDVEYVDVDPADPKYWNGVYIEGFGRAPMIPPRTPSYTWTRELCGNPTAAFVAFQLFAGPMLRPLQGDRPAHPMWLAALPTR